MPPNARKAFITLLYLSVTETTMGLAQYDEDRRKERAIYYLSKKMNDYETWYTNLEKTCLALVWATRKLRHVMLSYPVHLIARMDPPQKKVFVRETRLNGTGRTARWLLLLSEFDITYVTQKSIKGRAIAEHLAEHPIKEAPKVKDCFPDEEIAVTEEEGRAWK